jgi:hypothetical protein
MNNKFDMQEQEEESARINRGYNSNEYTSHNTVQQQVQPQHDVPSISHLERQMMFLNEPSIQNYQLAREGSELIK